jgi:hypothetical protein
VNDFFLFVVTFCTIFWTRWWRWRIWAANGRRRWGRRWAFRASRIFFLSFHLYRALLFARVWRAPFFRLAKIWGNESCRFHNESTTINHFIVHSFDGVPSIIFICEQLLLWNSYNECIWSFDVNVNNSSKFFKETFEVTIFCGLAWVTSYVYLLLSMFHGWS